MVGEGFLGELRPEPSLKDVARAFWGGASVKGGTGVNVHGVLTMEWEPLGLEYDDSGRDGEEVGVARLWRDWTTRQLQL